jgi:carbon-monoxide dehydrogenase medium subunit
MTNPRPVLPDFEYVQPKTVEEAVSFLKDHPDEARPFLGGTDCFIGIRDCRIKVKYLVDLKGLDGFDQLIFDKKGGLTVGAAVSMNRLIVSKDVLRDYPLIADASREVGSYQLRTRATLVGNLCNASPCGDTIAPCLVYEGTAHIIGQEGERRVPLADFFTGPGQTILEAGEIVSAVNLPALPAGAKGAYRSIGRNALGDLAIAASTVLGFPDKKVSSGFRFRIALTAVAPTVIFVPKAQKLLEAGPIDDEILDKAAAIASETCKPISDIRASAQYRHDMVATLTRGALETVWKALNTKTKDGA